MESEEALWDLYGRWMNHYNVKRDHLNEKHERFHLFKAEAILVHNINKSDILHSVNTCQQGPMELIQ
ncbi:Proteinase inhibitor I29 [Macleaya cordata]|uniref:Proteinase inhibitor I29 n=1 Tax=Macleaya cordata TaxID=56857 RepID=A0A200PRA6_MACCD|nr:Proteinase inhibitor I29 [Macleaya cordata]